MRISDWSSDVCSSDLRLRPPRVRRRGKPPLRLSSEGGEMSAFHTPNFRGWKVVMLHRENAGLQRLARQLERFGVAAEFAWPKLERSEEHTSELQSLMRISYAVFCLKKKKERKR